MIGTWKSIQSIRGYFFIQFGNWTWIISLCDHHFHSVFTLHNLFRTPFEVNTTARCASLVLWQAIAFLCPVEIFYSIISMFIELTMYTASFLQDITTIINQADRLSNDKISEQLMFDHWKNAVILHERVNRYSLYKCCYGFVIRLPNYFGVSDVCLN